MTDQVTLAPRLSGLPADSFPLGQPPHDRYGAAEAQDPSDEPGIRRAKCHPEPLGQQREAGTFERGQIPAQGSKVHGKVVRQSVSEFLQR